MAEQFFGRENGRDPLPFNGQGPASGPDLKTWVWAVHILHAATFVTGFTGVAAVIIAYIKRADAAGTIYESHLTYAIRSFWIGIGLSLVALVLCVLLVGFLLFALVGVWWLIRVIRPIIALSENRAINDPTGFF
ncbi:DUF4870 family protein [Tanticharoenia sakaeratensis]|jgi:uncharacterized membrane protein|uniref:Transmembrane protein n=1 Tax=Tanticharoenia sakaeratensis NBRC 103193 TaxID=1231623 RepID=A0A0D6MMU3_9PROT|nr:hypothetical protein [Tanticharoenia sakaeratensis]GAN54994.1 hypothetical protein Tasa_036_012 [Tanticharoenia sakaeratensis NBRC 103193]GBQ20433.1 hypothetical protein AA103193_1378 [Tanticharoenia sakaeratensis NBRC 103193]